MWHLDPAIGTFAEVAEHQGRRGPRALDNDSVNLPILQGGRMKKDPCTRPARQKKTGRAVQLDQAKEDLSFIFEVQDTGGRIRPGKRYVVSGSLLHSSALCSVFNSICCEI